MIGTADDDLCIQGLFQTCNIRRPHSIKWHNGYFYVVSSGKDSIFKVRLIPMIGSQEPVVSTSESVYWTFNNLLRTVHVNSLYRGNEGHFYVTAFGLAEAIKRDKKHPAGFLMDIETNRKIVGGLNSPHSVFSCADTLLFCESAKGTVRDILGSSIDLSPGYTRGIAATSDRLYIGISDIRDKSISGSDELLGTNSQTPCGAEIRVFDWKNYDLRTAIEIYRVNLRDWAYEIFDLLLY